jgi:(2Fe-2S) ferredoxin
MPTYIDCHPLAAIPSAVQQQMHSEAMHGIVDKHGAQPLAHWVTDGVIYCVMQAPSEEAFCQHHAERGVPCDNLHPIAGLRGSHPLLPDETQLVRAILADLWPPAGCVAA